LKILHIWDQAGVACVLSKYQRRHGHFVKILKRSGYDPFAIFKFYNEPLIDIDGKKFLQLAIKEAKDYDVIHIHSLFKIIPELRRQYNDKVLVLHYHGSEIRGKDIDSVRLEAEDRSDIILVSTSDLLDYISNDKVQYLPNPIDTEHFRNIFDFSVDKSLMITSNRRDISWILHYLHKNNFNAHIDRIIDRSSSPVPYSHLPNLLNQYSIYIDIKKYIDGLLLTSLSKTALEALACGLKVLRHDLKYIYGLPKNNEPEEAANRTLEVYNTISSKR
jgi:glycosyltransferase involved in cell wall biosynthesis